MTPRAQVEKKWGYHAQPTLMGKWVKQAKNKYLPGFKFFSGACATFLSHARL